MLFACIVMTCLHYMATALLMSLLAPVNFKCCL